MKKLAAWGVFFVVAGWAASVLAVPAHRSLTYHGGDSGPVIFQGKTHRQGCSECHRAGIFPVMRQGSETITMKKIDEGAQCGACHNGQQAFSSEGNCTRCHQTGEKR
ncbi:cytochrome c [Syntrophotalea carbinolica DSM 2380]|uniref:Cytochrome c n=1 Tax=Syntrophotalea carbinolica (strain DSM 2380 / NBRC 103641 / GraBd1) TaxID=338963 RepID=Q3A0V5_SYNC1|nr:cytochrome c3 family protein [Syntrophotalea carbinolica]ABA90002.2 cytochrome c [Syntrophotalea carbinolica DSM 2380]